MDESVKKHVQPPRRTCESLRLDIDAAMAGKTWLLLPEGFRDRESGKVYPLPCRRQELQKLIAIPIPEDKTDSGCQYLRRAMKMWRSRQERRQSVIYDVGRSADKAQNNVRKLVQLSKELRAEARAAVDEVKQEAQKAVAGLNDLFALGREGIERQMKAYLAGAEYQGEKIDGEAFRSCFRLVTQAVKGLGLPSDQRDKARDVVMEEVAKSVEATRSALSGETEDKETEH